MIRPTTRDRHVKIKARRRVGLAQITTEETLIMCSCGWAKIHQRAKIREDAAERHVAKKHHSRAVWL